MTLEQAIREAELLKMEVIGSLSMKLGRGEGFSRDAKEMREVIHDWQTFIRMAKHLMLQPNSHDSARP